MIPVTDPIDAEDRNNFDRTRFSTLTERQLLELIAERLVRFDDIANAVESELPRARAILEDAAPKIEALMRNPMLKMLGFGA